MRHIRHRNETHFNRHIFKYYAGFSLLFALSVGWLAYVAISSLPTIEEAGASLGKAVKAYEEAKEN